MKGNPMFASLKKFIRDESGATAIEYGLIAALISVAAIGAFTAVGSSLTSTFNNVASKLEAERLIPSCGWRASAGLRIAALRQRKSRLRRLRGIAFGSVG